MAPEHPSEELALVIIPDRLGLPAASAQASTPNDEDIQPAFKLLLIGNSGVGKTCIIFFIFQTMPSIPPLFLP